MHVGETIENYLETIYILLKRTEQIRAIDIANEMGYSKPTLSIMLKQLREKEMVAISPAGHITLTRKGTAIAEKVYEMHELLTRALIKLGVEENTAREDACKIEHVLSQETFAKIREHFNQNVLGIEADPE